MPPASIGGIRSPDSAGRDMNKTTEGAPDRARVQDLTAVVKWLRATQCLADPGADVISFELPAANVPQRVRAPEYAGMMASSYRPTASPVGVHQ